MIVFEIEPPNHLRAVEAAIALPSAFEYSRRGTTDADHDARMKQSTTANILMLIGSAFMMLGVFAKPVGTRLQIRTLIARRHPSP